MPLIEGTRPLSAIRFLGSQVAEHFAQDPERLARFRREAQMLAALNHSNIASIHGLGESNEVHYLVLEVPCVERCRHRKQHSLQLLQHQLREAPSIQVPNLREDILLERRNGQASKSQGSRFRATSEQIFGETRLTGWQSEELREYWKGSR
jgi:hypothetical protein